MRPVNESQHLLVLPFLPQWESRWDVKINSSVKIQLSSFGVSTITDTVIFAKSYLLKKNISYSGVFSEGQSSEWFSLCICPACRLLSELST